MVTRLPAERQVPMPRGRHLAISRMPLVMGIINVTPDSFSDGGVHLSENFAIESALRMAEDGAAIIDVGGESTRPGSEPVPLEMELDRVIPVIEGIRSRSDIAISVDTMKASVANAAIEAGADIVNDVTALRHDPDMIPLLAEEDTAVILMHMRGEPRTMQSDIHYDDLLPEILGELQAWRSDAIEAGIAPERILIDPGIGFGKTFDHNLEILARTERFAALAPVVIGASRKGFIGHLTGRESGPDRMPGSLAAVAAAALGGAAIVRVHDVRETVDFLKVFHSIRNASE